VIGYPIRSLVRSAPLACAAGRLVKHVHSSAGAPIWVEWAVSSGAGALRVVAVGVGGWVGVGVLSAAGAAVLAADAAKGVEVLGVGVGERM
jgi:hypothetical protein